MSTWKEVETATTYVVSKYGEIRNRLTGRLLKPRLDRYGYKKIQLVRDDGTKYYATVHRLVAIAWVMGCKPGLQVNHKDGIKTNNVHTNLEWVTISENVIHSFDMQLNRNTNPVVLEDLLTGEISKFRSIKSLCNHLNIYPSVLAPLIRHSFKNPILGKYGIRLIDERAIVETANTGNFGRSVFVFDSLTQTTTEYPSVLAAAYYTGLRTLSNLTNDSRTMSRVGYYYSFDRAALPSSTSDDLLAIEIQRTRYVNVPYVKRDHQYYLYDYYTHCESIFPSIDAVVDELNIRFPLRPVKRAVVSSAIGEGIKTSRTGLIRGLGIKSNRRELPWYPYTEEVIITNGLGKFAVPVYNVTSDLGEVQLVGKVDLCKYLNYWPDKSVTQITISEILKSCDIPNLSITRLNNPIE